MFGQEPDPDEVEIAIAALGRMLSRLGYRGELTDAFDRWAVISVPADLRPYSLVVSDVAATVSPAAVFDLLVADVRAVGQTPLSGLFWATLAAATGALAYGLVDRFMRRRR